MPLQRISDAVRGTIAKGGAQESSARRSGGLLLPGESDTLRGEFAVKGRQLADTVGAPGASNTNVRVYRWSQFHGEEHVTEFDDSHFELEGNFESNSSTGHKDYQDRLRAIHLRKEGKEKKDIAQVLGRSEKFVAKYWQKDPKEIPKPWGVHEYLGKELTTHPTSNNGAQVDDSTAIDTATWWRDVEIRRDFCKEFPGIFEEILNNTEWKSNVGRTRDFSTGASFMRYNKDGSTRLQGNQSAKYQQGQSPAFDKCMQKLFSVFGIADRTSGIGLNWYPDGQAMLGAHRHDCWTALFSFGSERILTIDKTPLLCRDGDLVIFGTQRHGVPVMPEIDSGRITVPVFFYPTGMQKQKMWQTITDPETMAPSRPLVNMLQNASLAGQAVGESDKLMTELVLKIVQLGFSHADAKAALVSCKLDPERAVEALLLSGATSAGGEGNQGWQFAVEADFAHGGKCSDVPSTAGRRNRFQKRRVEGTVESEQSRSAGSSSSCACGHIDQAAAADHRSFAVVQRSGAAVALDADGANAQEVTVGSRVGGAAAEDDVVSVEKADAAVDVASEEDAALAAWLQQEEEDAGFRMGLVAGCPVADEDTDATAVAMQLEELEAQRAYDPAAIAAQFAGYEDDLKRDEAESRWNGESGDLMAASGLIRETLTLEGMDKVTVYSVGHGDMLEQDFFEMLQVHSVRVLYDIRATDYRGEFVSRMPRFSQKNLRQACKARGIFYKHMPLGREAAYGMLAHIQSDEAQHTLIEICWQAKRKRTAFLGTDSDWRLDPRQVAAEELVQGGHKVEHVHPSGAVDQHVRCNGDFPDWLRTEEERLRKLEKMRKAGEMKRPDKSSVHRSSEVVALKLTKPAEELDAMAELREAKSQPELVIAQRKLARLQRIADQHGELANKVVKAAPRWILDDAKKQADWIAERKKEKEEAKARGDAGSSETGGGKAVSSSSSSTLVPSPSHAVGDQISLEEGLLVECMGCGQRFTWQALQAFDGRCATCASSKTTWVPQPLTVSDVADALQVECAGCGESRAWQLLQFGDGFCEVCFEGKRGGDIGGDSDDVVVAASAGDICASAQTVVASAPARLWRGSRLRQQQAGAMQPQPHVDVTT